MTDCLLPSQAAQILGVSVTRVRQLVDAGRIAATRGTMGIRLLDRSAVEAERARRALHDGEQAEHTGT